MDTELGVNGPGPAQAVDRSGGGLVVEKILFEDLDELIVGYLDPIIANEKK